MVEEFDLRDDRLALRRYRSDDAMAVYEAVRESINKADSFANLGYWVRTSKTRQGIATIATRLVARFGFDELKLNRIEIVVATDNIASLRVATKVGAMREGLMRRRTVVRDRTYDAVMFSLISEDIA